jgi:hypothetical protein
MKMKLSVVVLLFSALVIPVFGGIDAPWIGGYRISFDGYGDGSLPGEKEVLGLHLFVTPIPLKTLEPVLSVGITRPVRRGDFFVESSAEVRLFTLLNHPFRGLFRRDTAWRPALQVGALTPLADPKQSELLVTFAPFSFFFGEKTVSVLAPRFLYDPRSQTWQWGLRLLEISQSLF